MVAKNLTPETYEAFQARIAKEEAARVAQREEITNGQKQGVIHYYSTTTTLIKNPTNDSNIEILSFNKF
jgi:hypothetical protein